MRPNPPADRRHVLDPLGLVAGMCDALGMGDGLAPATHQHPDMRDRTVGEAVRALVLKGLGGIQQALALVPRFFPHQPIVRLLSPRGAPAQRHDDARGRALDTRYTDGVTERYRRSAATAAERVGLAPRCAHLASPRFHGAGRYHSDAAPDEPGIQSPRGDRRDQRPDLHQGRLEGMGEPQAGLPGRMPPRSGHSRDAHEFGQGGQEPRAPWQTTSGLTSRVADTALSSAGTLQTFAATRLQGITRVPATRHAAQPVLAQADPQGLAPLTEGDR